ncbi:hypothetical protein BD413DRAFT_261424 [Trametes elegans]|nr:hypothetical protein BD413DRAFT_261424 [Trametes elegans]
MECRRVCKTALMSRIILPDASASHGLKYSCWLRYAFHHQDKLRSDIWDDDQSSRSAGLSNQKFKRDPQPVHAQQLAAFAALVIPVPMPCLCLVLGLSHAKWSMLVLNTRLSELVMTSHRPRSLWTGECLLCFIPRRPHLFLLCSPGRPCK